MPNLRPNDRRVLALLIEHFNRKTERCDPGLDRISALLGVSSRTVIRSIHRLEAAGLLKKIRHGGFSHRNSYEPNWTRFFDFERIWNDRFRRSANTRRPQLTPSHRHPSHLEGDRTVNQTFKANPHQQTYSDSRQGGLSTPPTSAEAAAVEAERRWTTALHQHFAPMPTTYGEVIAAIDPSMRDAATNAELKRRGAGIGYIFRQLRLGSQKVETNG